MQRLRTDGLIRVWIADHAARTMAEEAAAHRPCEAGGVLLGYWSPSGQEVVVQAATRPGPKACHRESAYHPDADHDEAEVRRVYAASGRRSTYLGDWHSHPRQAAYLSRRDLRTLCRIARTESARAPMPLMVVVGQSDDAGWTVAGWVLTARPHPWPLLARPTPAEVVIFWGTDPSPPAALLDPGP